jgi:hydrogenase small subunit
VGCGHPCIGCSEKGVGFAKPIHQLATLKSVEPPLFYPRIVEGQGAISLGGAALLAGVAGAAAGAVVVMSKKLGKDDQGKGGKGDKSRDES